MSQNLWSYLRSQKYWCALFLVYLLAWIVPFHWMKEFWQYHYSLLAPQPFILIGFLLILWGRRQQIAASWLKINRAEKRNPKQKTTGSLFLLISGCLLYFFAHFSRLALAGILGLVLILIGVIVRVYGRKILRSLFSPILYLLAIVPWLPESFSGKIDQIFQRISIFIIQQSFIRTGNAVIINGDALVVNNATISLPFGISGSQGLFSAIIIFWAYGLYRLYNFSKILHHIFIGCLVTELVYLIRFSSLCYFTSAYPNLALFLANLNSWIITGIGISLSFLILKFLPPFRVPSWIAKFAKKAEKTSNAIQRPVDQVITKSVTAGSKIGGSITVIFKPIVWIFDKTLLFFTKGGQWLSRTNRNLDSRLRKADRSRAQRKKNKSRR
jgi:hypothetical protein